MLTRLLYDADMNAPLIGLDTDLATDNNGVERCTLRTNYVKAIVDAGGLPVLLPPVPELAHAYVQACDGILLTGGDDPRTESFGQPTHPQAKPIESQRQAFIVALLKAIDQRPSLPTLGVCLGMQMMALHAGGKLHQFLPDILDDAKIHQACTPHSIQLSCDDSVLFKDSQEQFTTDPASLVIVSAHRQSVSDAGRLRIVAKAFDGVVEAVDDPARRYYAGVQWHPERGDQRCLSLGLLKRFVAVCRNAS